MSTVTRKKIEELRLAPPQGCSDEYHLGWRAAEGWVGYGNKPDPTPSVTWSADKQRGYQDRMHRFS